MCIRDSRSTLYVIYYSAVRLPRLIIQTTPGSTNCDNHDFTLLNIKNYVTFLYSEPYEEIGSPISSLLFIYN